MTSEKLPAGEFARPLATWHEDRGAVLWWQFPIHEPPYVGTPLDSEWPGYHTHWTPIAIPLEPQTAQFSSPAELVPGPLFTRSRRWYAAPGRPLEYLDEPGEKQEPTS